MHYLVLVLILNDFLGSSWNKFDQYQIFIYKILVGEQIHNVMSSSKRERPLYLITIKYTYGLSSIWEAKK